ncbi:MAG: ATP synthase subunit C [Oscillospiraceae bacterium]|jgi:V/A-type H+-transporting ATPase subunit K|nr:ATP synthase subunit C [Oscillospiraceae bacterium]MCI7500020.1 ATP synthase subunit C [Oscillospiraceae bacterium]MDD7279157.1 ATP synthase subunit C [Oscillospiraceae bacterium]MDY2863757.1 ATP synthase subunit C [Oscillospiraceae bacterium]
MYIFLLPLAVVILLALPVISRIKHFTDGTKCKNAIIGNICSFFGVMLLAVILPLGNFVSAEVVEETAGVISSAGMGYLAAALAVGLGSIGCGIAVANAAPAAIGAVAEEPSCFGKAMIFVALGEGVALYGFLIAFLIIQAV